MTVRYSAPLATNSSLGCFTQLLFRWRGSVYKLIWAEYLIFIFLYYLISLIYRFGLNLEHQKYFEKIVNYCEKSQGSVEMSFVLGFFVSSIVSKWWQLYQTIPWPDPVALLLNASIRGEDPITKDLKLRIIRHCNLNLILTFRLISPPYFRRYPTLDHLVKEDLLTEPEKSTLKMLEKKEKSGCPTQWLPITWATELVMKAESEGRIRSEVACQRIIDELDKFRHGCALLLEYEHNSVPLVYIQVVTICVYTYFLSCLMGSQWLIHDKNLENLDLYFPFFTTLQFIFYMGWLKVAESLINPFGCDDDDFELEDIVDRHIQVTYMMVSGKEWTAGRISTADKNSVTKPHYVNLAFREYENSSSNSKVSDAIARHSLTPSPRVQSPPPKFSDVVIMEEDENEGDEEMGVDRKQSLLSMRMSILSDEIEMDRKPSFCRARFMSIQDDGIGDFKEDVDGKEKSLRSVESKEEGEKLSEL